MGSHPQISKKSRGLENKTTVVFQGKTVLETLLIRPLDFLFSMVGLLFLKIIWKVLMGRNRQCNNKYNYYNIYNNSSL